jgi:hypothetical protein
MKEAKMPRATRTYFICAALLFAIPGMRSLQGADLKKELPATVMEKVTPTEVRAGDMVTVTGETLDAAHLKEVYITDRKDQVEVEIVAQGPNYLRFKMPKVEPGKWRIAIKLVRDEMFLEEPVFVIVLPDKG